MFFVYAFLSRVVSVNKFLQTCHTSGNKKRCCSYKWNRQYYLNCKIAIGWVCETEAKESEDAVFTFITLCPSVNYLFLKYIYIFSIILIVHIFKSITTKSKC